MNFKETRAKLLKAKVLSTFKWSEVSEDYEGSADYCAVSVLRADDGTLWYSSECNSGRGYARLLGDFTKEVRPGDGLPCPGDVGSEQTQCEEAFGVRFDESTYVDGYV